MFTNYVIDDREGRQGSTDNLPKGLKSYPRQFNRLPYYEHLQIVHLFDSMHIGKNITETLWKYWMEGVTKKKLSKFVMTFMNPIMH